MKQLRLIILVLILVMSSIAVSAQNNYDSLIIGVLVTDADINPEDASAIRQSVQLAVDEINDAGGIEANNGTVYRVQVSFKDVANSSDVVTAIEELTAEGAVAILGPDSNALLPDISTLQIPMLITSSGFDGAYTKISDFAFQLRANDDSLARMAVTFAVEELDTEDLAILSSESTYADVAVNAMLEEVEDMEETTIVLNRSHAVSDTDMSAIVDDIVSENPEAIIVADRFVALENLLNGLSNSDWSGDVIYLYAESTMLNLMPGNDIDLYGLSIWSEIADDNRSEDFVDLYIENYELVPGQLEVLYYDAIYLLDAAIESTGDDPARIENWLDANADYTGVQGEYNPANPDGELIRSAFVLQYEDGEVNEEQRYVLAQNGVTTSDLVVNTDSGN